MDCKHELDGRDGLGRDLDDACPAISEIMFLPPVVSQHAAALTPAGSHIAYDIRAAMIIDRNWDCEDSDLPERCDSRDARHVLHAVKTAR